MNIFTICTISSFILIVCIFFALLKILGIRNKKNSGKWIRISFLLLIVLLIIELISTFIFNPKDITSKPEFTVTLCGSTTLGERFAPDLIEAVARENQANTIESKSKFTKGINIHFYVNFPKDTELFEVEATKEKETETKSITFEKGLVEFKIDAQGTGDGLKKFKDEKCDILMASYILKAEDLEIEEEKFNQLLLAKDAIAIITSTIKENNNFSIDELKSIFEGNKQDIWRVFFRKDSGTTSELKNALNIDQQKKFLGAIEVESNKEMLEKVIQAKKDNQAAMGYLSYSFIINLDKENFYVVTVDNEYPILQVPGKSKENNLKNIDINFINQEYKMKRSLYLYIQNLSDKEQRDKKEQIIHWIVNKFAQEGGQAIIQSEGFASTAINSILAKNDSQDIIHIYKKIEKMREENNFDAQDYSPNMTIYFGRNETVPDFDDVRNQFNTLRKKEKEEPLYLIGHASQTGGSENFNIGLSFIRAKEVENIIKTFDNDNLKLNSYGLGWDYPNLKDPNNNDKNRRVEIYTQTEIDDIQKRLGIK